ncbi:MAG TPA: dihydrodipicolinate synthase family protein [Terracidiphilus sp.]|nr:dihydrodipicolinate synthase family protein [Terracidiphilus sp.]
MSTEATQAPVHGIIPPMATPLAGPDELDVAGLGRLIEHILQGGVHGLFILGTTGEGPALSYRLRRELIQRTCSQVAGRVPVLVGVTDSAYPEMLQMTECAAASGANAIVVAPPFYFPLSQSDLLRLVEGLASHSVLPLYLYNQPELTKMTFTPETVERASAIPKVAGIKDSSGDMDYLNAVLGRMRGHPEFAVLVGPEHLLHEALRNGANGGVPGGANIFPDLPVRLYQAFNDGDDSLARKLQELMVTVGRPIWECSEAGPGYLRRLKCALSLLGLCMANPAWPCVESAPEERLQIENHLREHGMIPR